MGAGCSRSPPAWSPRRTRRRSTTAPCARSRTGRGWRSRRRAWTTSRSSSTSRTKPRFGLAQAQVGLLRRVGQFIASTTKHPCEPSAGKAIAHCIPSSHVTCHPRIVTCCMSQPSSPCLLAILCRTGVHASSLQYACMSSCCSMPTWGDLWLRILGCRTLRTCTTR